MAYLELMILLSRYIFAGFGLVFIIVCFSFMKPFISYSLGQATQKLTLMFSCIVFFHVGATGILLGKAVESSLRWGILINSAVFLAVIFFSKIILKILRRQDELVLWYVLFFLLDIGYIMLERLDHTVAIKQIAWTIIGMTIALFGPSLFGMLIKAKYRVLYMVITIIFIFLPFVFGESKYGAMNWVQIGPIGFQPSEFGKVTFIMFLAAHFHEFTHSTQKWRKIIEAVVFTGVILLALVMQRDLGGALLYFSTFLILLYMGTKNALLPLVGVVGGSGAAVVAYALFGHVRVRVQAWLNPWADVTNTGYQVVQGLFAMGTWGWFGSGLTRGIPDKIPIVTTDYIFAAICEEFGNLFSIVVLLCYLAIILQGLKAALIQLDDFSKYLCTGIVILLALQTLIIVGGVMKLIPLTGITLPFVSYGGTSMVVSLSMIGILTYLLRKTLKFTRKEGEEVEE